jgi:citrate lyase subunit beta/citryl-CoA lyase
VKLRSTLMVPAHHPRKLEKAPQVGADMIVLDLEDSVPADKKEEARQSIRPFLNDLYKNVNVAVRINPPWTIEGNRDLRALASFGVESAVDCILVPKVRTVTDVLGMPWAIQLMPVVETPQAILNLDAIMSVKRVMGATFGLADYAAGMRTTDRHPDPHAYNLRFLYAKQKLATACAAYDKHCLDTSFFVKGQYADRATEAMWTDSKAWGFTGAGCIHPSQVEVAHRIFNAKATELMWAQRTVFGEVEHEGEVWVDDDGLVVGRPVVRQAEGLLKEVGL